MSEAREPASELGVHELATCGLGKGSLLVPGSQRDGRESVVPRQAFLPVPVEGQVDHGVDDATQPQLNAQMESLFTARHRRKGRFVCPSGKVYRRPVFARVADLPKRDEGGGPDEVDPVD